MRQNSCEMMNFSVKLFHFTLKNTFILSRQEVSKTKLKYCFSVDKVQLYPINPFPVIL